MIDLFDFQVVNLIPVTRHMPKWGEGEVYEQTSPTELGPEGQQRPGASLTKGQILWLRGITRLQTQVGRQTLTILAFFSFVPISLPLPAERRNETKLCSTSLF